MNAAGYNRRRQVKILSPLLALLLVAAGCGGSDEDKGLGTAGTSATETSTDASTDTSEPTTTTADGSEAATSESTETSAVEDSTTTAATDPDGADELPGEPIDLFVELGDVLGVVGVSDDDTLNVRSKPGTDQDVLTTVGPTADDLVGTGRARSLPSSIWYELSVGGDIGWVSSSFVAFFGGTDDATAEFLADGGSVSAETMTDLGRLVAERFASEDPPSRVVQTVAPTVGDLGEVTYDVVGIGDDAVLGYRLHIFATEDENGETFTIRTIERTTLCTRGTDGERCS